MKRISRTHFPGGTLGKTDTHYGLPQSAHTVFIANNVLNVLERTLIRSELYEELNTRMSL